MGVAWKPANEPTYSTSYSNGGSYGGAAQVAQPQESEAWSAYNGQEGRPIKIGMPRWWTAKSSPAQPPPKIIVTAQDVRQVIADQIGDRLAQDFRLFLGDNSYFYTPLADAQEIIANSGLSRRNYMPENFDCDDFAIVLKAHFCEAAYKDFERRAPHCIGLIWGELPHVHAVNWMINDDARLRFIEPQTGEIFDPKPEHRNVTFMMA